MADDLVQRLRDHYQREILDWDLLIYAADALARKDAEISELRVEVERLGGMVYVPGAWSCPKCSLRLLASTLSAIDGGISSDNSPQTCANGCGPMWRVTERDERRDAYATAEQWSQRAERAEARVREAPVVIPEPARFEVAPEEYRDGASVEVPAQMIGKRVALVPLDTEEAK